MNIKSRIRLLLSSFVFLCCLATGAAEQLKVYVFPSVIPDSGACNIFSDRSSRFDFLFYYAGDKPITDLSSGTLTLDLPKGLGVRSVALMAGWRKSGGKFYDFKQEPVNHDGAEYIRHTLPLPPAANNKIITDLGGISGGICYNQTRIFVEPRGATPRKFNAYWNVKKGDTDVSGHFPMELFDTPYGLPVPKRIVLRADGWGEISMFADLSELSSVVQLYRILGITQVPSLFKGNLEKAGLPDLWTKAGFEFYDGDIWKVLNAYSEEQRTQAKEDRDYFVGLDGKSSKGGDWNKHQGRLFCPVSASTPGRFAFEKLREAAEEAICHGAKFIDLDLEIQYWNHCFCDDCLKQHAKFAALNYDDLKKTKPADIVMASPMTWYRFRCAQTAELYRNLRKEIQKAHPEVKIGANDVMVYPELDLEDLKWGACSFGEDPRLIDGAVDYHMVDTLMGCVADPVWLDAQRRGTDKPLIAVAGCSYTTGFSHCNTVGRRYLAERSGVGTGYDIRGEFMKLNMVHLAASGASGLRLQLEDDNGVIDAEVAAKVAEGAAALAATEDFYLDGRRDDGAVEVVDLTGPPSPCLKDKTSVRGGVWKHFHDLYGHVQYRVHARKDDMLISLFNWDPIQDKQWLVRLKDAPGRGFCVSDQLGKTAYLVGGETAARWSKRRLEQGLLLTVPAAGMRILRLGADFPGDIVRTETIPPEKLKADAEQAAALSPADQYAWRKGGKLDIRENIIKEWKRRNLPFFEPGIIPEKYLNEVKD